MFHDLFIENFKKCEYRILVIIHKISRSAGKSWNFSFGELK